MRLLRPLAFAALLATPAAATAQGNPVSDAARMNATDLAKNLVAAARLMPAEKYGFKPTPAEMSFGQLIAHIAGDNHITCSAIAGQKPTPRAKVAAADGKEKLVAALQASMDECDAALKGLKDAAMGDTVPYYGQNYPRALAAFGLLIDWSDHYAQQAIYLRLNGILPPTARQGSGM